MDMIASEAEREEIAREVADGEKVWWMTPGWIQFRRKVFRGWDKGLANENFPRHTGGAIVLDGIGFMDRYMAEKPEEFLEYADWMGIPITPYSVTFDRFKSLLAIRHGDCPADKALSDHHRMSEAKPSSDIHPKERRRPCTPSFMTNIIFYSLGKRSFRFTEAGRRR
jgi:hypothetical protein